MHVHVVDIIVIQTHCIIVVTVASRLTYLRKTEVIFVHVWRLFQQLLGTFASGTEQQCGTTNPPNQPTRKQISTLHTNITVFSEISQKDIPVLLGQDAPFTGIVCVSQ